MNILKQQPVFNLRIDTFGTDYIVSLNGVSIITEFDVEGQLTASFPVNHWMHPQDTQINVEIIPSEEGGAINPHAYLNLELKILENSNPGLEYTLPILSFKGSGIEDGSETSDSLAAGHYTIADTFAAKEDGEIIFGAVQSEADDEGYKGTINYNRHITLENSLPLWAFYNSDEMPNYYTVPDEEYYAVRDELLVEYMKLQNALETGEIEGILPMFDERNKETDAAFYKKPGATAARIKEVMLKKINNPELVLVGLTPKKVGVNPELNRKLVSLLRSGNDNAVSYDYKSGGSTSFPMMFRHQNGKWILTR